MEVEIGLKITKLARDEPNNTFQLSRRSGGPFFFSSETDTIFLLVANLSGFGKEQIKIEINELGTEIAISGQMHIQEITMATWRVQTREAEIRRFRKVFRIPSCVILDGIEARFDEDDTLLSIFMPKSKNALPGIQIQEVVTETHKPSQEFEQDRSHSAAEPLMRPNSPEMQQKHHSSKFFSERPEEETMEQGNHRGDPEERPRMEEENNKSTKAEESSTREEETSKSAEAEARTAWMEEETIKSIETEEILATMEEETSRSAEAAENRLAAMEEETSRSTEAAEEGEASMEEETIKSTGVAEENRAAMEEEISMSSTGVEEEKPAAMEKETSKNGDGEEGGRQGSMEMEDEDNHVTGRQELVEEILGGEEEREEEKIEKEGGEKEVCLPCIFAGSAFLVSLIVLVIHLLKNTAKRN